MDFLRITASCHTGLCAYHNASVGGREELEEMSTVGVCGTIDNGVEQSCELFTRGRGGASTRA